MGMNDNAIKTISIITSALISGVSINLIFLAFENADTALMTTMIAFTASGMSLDFYKRLSRKYGVGS